MSTEQKTLNLDMLDAPALRCGIALQLAVIKGLKAEISHLMHAVGTLPTIKAERDECMAGLIQLHTYCQETNSSYRNGLNNTDPLYRKVSALITKATGVAA